MPSSSRATGRMTPLDLHAAFTSCASSTSPCLACWAPRPVSARPCSASDLRAALQAHGVRLLEGQALTWRGWTLIGLDDAWGGEPASQIAALWPSTPNATPPATSPSAPSDPKLVIVHQPDTVAQLPHKPLLWRWRDTPTADKFSFRCSRRGCCAGCRATAGGRGSMPPQPDTCW